ATALRRRGLRVQVLPGPPSALWATRRCLEPAPGTQRVARRRVAPPAGHDQAMPHEEHENGADRGANETRPLVQTIPAELLAQVGRNERPGDPNQRGEHEARRVVGPGKQMACDDAGNKADKDDPEDVHEGVEPLARAQGGPGCWGWAHARL